MDCRIGKWMGMYLLVVRGAFFPPALGQQYVISTYAGGAPLPTPAPALEISIGAPSGLAVDTAGNVYFISVNSIYRLDGNGIVTRVAGNSRQGYSGDGGAAINAQLRLSYFTNGVFASAITFAGDNLFIADKGNHRIRKVSRDGIIVTAAGNGTEGFSGDGGLATAAQLSSPTGIAADGAGNLFIADWGNRRVRKVSPEGIITTVAGVGKCCGSLDDGVQGGSAHLEEPTGVAVDGRGNLFIADHTRDRILKVSPAGIITTVAVNETQAPSDVVRSPICVAVDVEDNVLVTDSLNRVRKISPDGAITTVAGKSNGTQTYSGDDGPAADAQLSSPQGIALDSAGNLYIADAFNYRIRKVSPDGRINTVAGNGVYSFAGDGGPATSARLALGGGDPSALGSVAVDSDGNLFIADTGNHRIRKVSPGGMVTTVAGTGTPGYLGNNGPAIEAELKYPFGLAVDDAGSLFIADTGNGFVRKVSRDGMIATVPGSDSDHGVAAVAVDHSGNLYIAASDRVRRFSPNGTITIVAGGGSGFSSAARPATEAKLFYLCAWLLIPRATSLSSIATAARTRFLQMGSSLP